MVLYCDLQAICFYIPGWLWDNWEKGSVEDVVGDNGLKDVDYILGESKEECEARADQVADKVLALRGSHNKWAVSFLFCEFLNFIVTISQIFFTNFFLGGKGSDSFLLYGYDMIRYVIDENSCHPMKKVSYFKHFNSKLYIIV